MIRTTALLAFWILAAEQASSLARSLTQAPKLWAWMRLLK